MVYPVLQVQVAMLVAGLYEIIPLLRGLSVGQGAVGGGGQYWIKCDNNYSQHSLKVTHLLRVVSEATTQQYSPSGLKCVGPRCRTTAAGLLIPLMNTSSSVATPLTWSMRTVPPPGSCHTTLVGVEVQQYQACGSVPTPDPTSENEMISPVWSVLTGSFGCASRTAPLM